MKKNMGIVDRVIRVIAAIVIGGLYYTGVMTGTLAVILGVVAVIFLLTGVTGFCPAYAPFGFSTLKEKK